MSYRGEAKTRRRQLNDKIRDSEIQERAPIDPQNRAPERPLSRSELMGTILARVDIDRLPTSIATDYIDLGTQNGLTSLNIALAGNKQYIRKITLANSTPLSFSITSSNLLSNIPVSVLLVFAQDSTGGRAISTSLSSTLFPDGDSFDELLNKDANATTIFRLTSIDGGATWRIEILSPVGGGIGTIGPQGEPGDTGDTGGRGLPGDPGLRGPAGTDATSNFSQAAIDGLERITVNVASAIERITSGIASAILRITDTVASAITRITSTVASAILRITDTVASGILRITDTVASGILRITDTVIEGITRITSTVIESILRITDTVASAITRISSTVASSIVRITDTVASAILRITSTVASSIVRITDTVASGILRISTTVATGLTNLSTTVANNIEAIFTNVGILTSTFTTKLTDSLNSVYTTATQVTNSVTNSINSALLTGGSIANSILAAFSRFASDLTLSATGTLFNILDRISLFINGGMSSMVTFPLNFPELDGGDIGPSSVAIDFSESDRHSRKYTLTGDVTFAFTNPPTGKTGYVNLVLVQNEAGGNNIILPPGTVNKELVETGLLRAGNQETGIVIKWSFGTYFAFLESGNQISVSSSGGGGASSFSQLTGIASINQIPNLTIAKIPNLTIAKIPDIPITKIEKTNVNTNHVLIAGSTSVDNYWGTLANIVGTLPFSKLENLTTSRALISNSSGDVSASTLTASQLLNALNGYPVGPSVQSRLATLESSGGASSFSDLSGTASVVQLPIIPFSKLANLTTSRALISNSSGDVTTSTLTSASLLNALHEYPVGPSVQDRLTTLESGSGEDGAASSFLGLSGTASVSQIPDIPITKLTKTNLNTNHVLIAGSTSIDNFWGTLQNIVGTLPFSKLENLETTRALITNSSGQVTASSITATSLLNALHEYPIGPTVQTRLMALEAGGSGGTQSRIEDGNTNISIGAETILFHVNGTQKATWSPTRFNILDDVLVHEDLEINGDLNHDGSRAGFRGRTPIAGRSWQIITNGVTLSDYRQSVQAENTLSGTFNASTFVFLLRAFKTLVSDLKEQGIII